MIKNMKMYKLLFAVLMFLSWLPLAQAQLTEKNGMSYRVPDSWNAIIKENGDAQILVPAGSADAAVLTFEKLVLGEGETAPAFVNRVFAFCEEAAGKGRGIILTQVQERTIKLTEDRLYLKIYEFASDGGMQTYGIGVLVTGKSACLITCLLAEASFPAFYQEYIKGTLEVQLRADKVYKNPQERLIDEMKKAREEKK
jgi:hypothetical protein